MGKIELECSCCKKVDNGAGVWSPPQHPLATERRVGLCPDCCRQRFPQFYSDYQKPHKFRSLMASTLKTVLSSKRKSRNKKAVRVPE
jgi:hypothetical protein